MTLLSRYPLLSWLWPFIHPQRLALLGLLGLALLASALVLVQPWLTKLLIDRGLLAGDYATLVLLAAALIAVGLLGTVLGGFNRYFHTRLSGRILFALREDLYAHLARLSPTFYARRATGDLLSRLDGDIAEIQRFAVDSLFATVSNTLGLVGAVALMLTLSWELSLLLLLLIPLEVAFLRRMRRRVEQGTRQVRERSAELSSFLVETLPAMKFIQSVAAESRASRQLQGLGGRYLDDLLQLQMIQYLTGAVPGTLVSLSRAAAFLLGGYWVIQGHWPLGSLIAFSAYLGMSLGPVQGLLGLYMAAQRVQVSVERVLELRRELPDVSAPINPHPLPAMLRGEIVLEGVTFRHADSPQPLLTEVNACFPAGAKIALTGPSGVGKSTLTDLILRHYDPQQGRLLLDGLDLRQLDLSELRQRVALVSQDIVLFRGSLADNLRYACPTADAAAVAEAAHRAQLTEFIATLPQGLDTPVGERGTRLSGGQKQRVAIARALLQNPAVLILDEATSAVDAATEAQIIAAVDELFAGRTRVLISHRPATLAGADLTLILQEGQLQPVPLERENPPCRTS